MHPKLHGRHGKARPCWNGYPAMLCFRERAFVERVYPAMLWQLWERVYLAIFGFRERAFVGAGLPRDALAVVGAGLPRDLCWFLVLYRPVLHQSRASRGKPAPTVEQKQEQSIAG